MFQQEDIPDPILFSPLKHYLPFIKSYISARTEEIVISEEKLTKELTHLGTSVMDIYRGRLTQSDIFNEISFFLNTSGLISRHAYSEWVGTRYSNYKTAVLSDSSKWTLKYHNNVKRYVHIFPSRSSPHTIRVKSNTLKSAILYLILIGKDFVTEDDLNMARAAAGLSPVKDVSDTAAVTEMIEILRD